MKTFKYTTMLLLVLISTFALRAQSKKQQKEAEVKSMIESKKYTFIAQYANPLGGGHRYLNYDYDLRIKPDSVISYLPYFGQVTFDPPIYPTDDGVKFKSTKFGYTVTTRKNGTYLISITPRDAKYIQQLYLTVGTNGYASLQVTITNRTSISYDGYIADTSNDKNNAKDTQQTAKAY